MNSETGIRPPIGPLSALASAQAKPRAEMSPPALARNQGDGAPQPAAARFASASAEVGESPFARPLSAAAEASASNDDFSFADFLDIINPLQHIPIISTAYRAITGDEISAPARILGGFAYGGPLGFISSVANAVVDEISGDDIGETVLAALFEDTDAESPAVAAVAPSVTRSSAPAAAAKAVFTDATQPASLNTAALELAPKAISTPPSRKEQAFAVPVLKGQDALNALRSDIRDIKAATSATETSSNTDTISLPRNMENTQPARTGPIPLFPPHRNFQGALRVSADPSLFTANQPPATGLATKDNNDTPGHLFTEQMLDGLEKYQAMAQERNRTVPQYDGNL